MKVIHLIGGGDVGGAKVHVLSLVKELSRHIDVKLISFRPGIFSDEAKEMGIDIEIVKSGNILKDILYLKKLIKENGYQLIHSHGAKANMTAVFLKKFVGLPVVTTVHSDYKLDYMESFIKKYTFGAINTIALRFIDFFIGVSKNFKEMLIERNFNPNKVFTLYNGIDFNRKIPHYDKARFSNKYRLNLNHDDMIVGILARLHPVKDLSSFIDAAKVVVEKKPNIKFLIGGPGEGEEKRFLHNKVKSLGLKNNVLFLGYVDNPYEFMCNIDINVLTSISESFPYSILEGTLLKKPTISTDVGGISDLIINGVNGYLLNPGDYMMLADYILRLAEKPELRNEFGEKIYDKSKKEFSLDSMCRTQIQIYDSVLKFKEKDSKQKPAHDVVISGYYGFKNIGDEAMLSAIIKNLKENKKDINILVLSRNPLETKKMYEVDSINRFNPVKVLCNLKKSKLFINGGGNLIQDNTSSRSLFYYLIMIWLAKKLGMKVMIYANGIGPINKKINRKLTRVVLNHSDVITLREEYPSRHELYSLNIDKPEIKITADPALMIEPCEDYVVQGIFMKEGIDLEGPYVGFSVRNWDGHQKYVDIIARLADHLMEKFGLKPVFIPMHYPDDLTVIRKIASKMKNKSYIINHKYSVTQTMGIINKMEMLIGMRLHALIFAVSLGIPVIGLVYEPKVEGFLNATDQMSAGYVNQLDYEKLKVQAEEIWNNRNEAKDKVKWIADELKNKAMENARIAIDLVEENS